MEHVYFWGHHKCATTWMRRILRGIAEREKYEYQVKNGYNDPLFFSDAHFSIHMFVNSDYALVQSINSENAGCKGVHVLRDLRDALISQYWSWKLSHPPNFEPLISTRPVLVEKPMYDGLAHLLENDLLWCAEQLQHWNPSDLKNIINIKYEDLVRDTEGEISAMVGYLFNHSVSQETIKRVVENSTFHHVSGRERGEEERTSHLRKGMPGDWKNYFNEDITDLFKLKYGQLLIDWGYEASMNW